MVSWALTISDPPVFHRAYRDSDHEASSAESLCVCRLQISHWRGIREVLEANGCEVMITRVPATSSTKVRSEILMAAIEEKYPGREVNLIGHSMVGLSVAI